MTFKLKKFLNCYNQTYEKKKLNGRTKEKKGVGFKFNFKLLLCFNKNKKVFKFSVQSKKSQLKSFFHPLKYVHTKILALLKKIEFTK